MEGLAYYIKQRFPSIFALIERTARVLTVLRFSRRLNRARARSNISGSVHGEKAEIRALGPGDTELLCEFLQVQPSEHLNHFRPHEFDRFTLKRILESDAFLCYGLFVSERMVGYALLKVAPTGSAFIGLLVEPQYSGMGLGTFIVRFLYWQASLAGLRARSTISQGNPASLAAHQAVADFRVVAELPNDYLMIEFPPGDPDVPELAIG